METERTRALGRSGARSDISKLSATAAVSLAVLIGAIAWNIGAAQERAASHDGTVAAAVRDFSESDSDRDGTPDWKEALAGSDQNDPSSQPGPNDPASLTISVSATSGDSELAHATPAFWNTIASGYASLSSQGAYTPQRGEELAQTIADSMQAHIEYRQYTASDITIEGSDSSERASKYRTDMQAALAPLLENKEPAFSVYARFITKGDESALDDLRSIAGNYRKSEALLIKVPVPGGAAETHVRLLNVLEHYASVVDAFVNYGRDNVAGIQILKAYNDVEGDVIAVFNSLAHYYAAHIEH